MAKKPLSIEVGDPTRLHLRPKEEWEKILLCMTPEQEHQMISYYQEMGVLFVTLGVWAEARRPGEKSQAISLKQAIEVRRRIRQMLGYKNPCDGELIW